MMEFEGAMTDTEKHYEKLLAEACREREQYNGMHQIAVMEIERLREALDNLVNAKALVGVRSIVAGWNGENRSDGPYERHPATLGATLPKTNCGAIYALDEAMQHARAVLARTIGYSEK